MLLSAYTDNRWAPTDGAIELQAPDGEAVVSSEGGEAVSVVAAGGIASVPAAVADQLLGTLGARVLTCAGVDYRVERVGGRYTDRAAVIAYGKQSNDGFEDEARYPAAAFAQAILAAEVAIERACGRSFCKRSISVTLRPGKVTELPVADAYAIQRDDPAVRLVSVSQVVGVTAPVPATVEYGVSLDSQMHIAATKLAASYLRPRAGAENARGASSDGVYVSYELATGDDGSWTGLPFVDAAIEAHRSRRGLIA